MTSIDDVCKFLKEQEHRYIQVVIGDAVEDILMVNNSNEYAVDAIDVNLEKYFVHTKDNNKQG